MGEKEQRLELLSERDAAKVLGLSTFTLRNWRQIRKGPPYRKLGRAVRYAVGDLETWAAARSVTVEG